VVGVRWSIKHVSCNVCFFIFVFVSTHILENMHRGIVGKWCTSCFSVLAPRRAIFRLPPNAFSTRWDGMHKTVFDPSPHSKTSNILLSSQFWPMPSMSRGVINCAKMFLSHPFRLIKTFDQWAVDRDPVLISTTSAKIGKTAIVLLFSKKWRMKRRRLQTTRHDIELRSDWRMPRPPEDCWLKSVVRLLKSE